MEAEGGECSKRKVTRGECLRGAMRTEKLCAASRPVDKPWPRPRVRGVCVTWDESSELRWAGRFQADSQVQVIYKMWDVDRGGVMPASQAFGFCD